MRKEISGDPLKRELNKFFNEEVSFELMLNVELFQTKFYIGSPFELSVWCMLRLLIVIGYDVIY